MTESLTLEKLQPRTIVHQVIEALIGAAANGLILPGDRIIEGDIASRLGVSRVPVREALRVLESQGVVLNEPYKGIRLMPVTPERIDHLIEVRVALESTAATRVIKQGLNRGKALIPLKDAIADMQAMCARNDVFGFASADTQFHRELCLLSGNDVLYNMWEMLARQMTIIFGLSTLGKAMSEVVDEHLLLIQVFESGDVNAMHEAITEHIDVEIHKVDLQRIIERRRSEQRQPAASIEKVTL